jgi:aminoglycoside phosphotransferase (APT) family kinase protein
MEELEAGVRAILGADGELALTPIPGGASRETWLVESDGERRVLRRDPEGSVSLVPIANEFGLIERAHEAGVPVPAPLMLEPAGGRLGTAAMLVSFVEGTSVAPRILRKPEYQGARSALTAQLGEALARIHSIDPGDLETIVRPAGADPALDQIEEWERQLDEIGEPLPAVELGLRWLRVHAPAPTETALVHGDFRLGNFIVDESGLAAVIDWELAHLGDPAEDVGWLCIRSWRFGNDSHPIAGVGSFDEFASAYEAAGGRRLELDRVRYWEIFGNLKWAVICARQAHDHLNDVRRSHELGGSASRNGTCSN